MKSGINAKSILRRLPSYVRRFGPVGGVSTAFAIERALPASSQSAAQFAVPGWKQGVFLRDNMGDHATFWQCIVQEQYRLDRFPQYPRLRQQYESMLASGTTPVIVDCGANIGLSAIWFANEFPRAKVIAVEPDGGNFDMLRRNSAPYGDTIVPVRGGIWPERGQVRVENPEAGSAAFRVTACAADHPDALETFTVNGLCSDIGCSTPFIVKVDIEGAQAKLFASNIEWVAATSLIILELDDWQFPWAGTSRSFFSAVSPLPFDYLLGGESIFCFRDESA